MLVSSLTQIPAGLMLQQAKAWWPLSFGANDGMNVCHRAHHYLPLSSDSITSHICQLINAATSRKKLSRAELCQTTCMYTQAMQAEQGRVCAVCIVSHEQYVVIQLHCFSNIIPLSAKECWVKKHSKIQLVSTQSQAELEEKAGLFKGLKSAVQMLNFVVFHLFPVLNVLANDMWVTSGELGKSWDSVLAMLPRSGLLPWTLMSDSRNEMLPLRPETITTERINIHLS